MNTVSIENERKRYRRALNQCLHDISYIETYMLLYNQIFVPCISNNE